MAKTWNILSIDGGGIRGVIPAVLLAELENRMKNPLIDTFDLIAGTSTGGIIALALVAPPLGDKQRTASELVKLYEDNAVSIFPPTISDLVGDDSGTLTLLYNLIRPKHKEEGLTQVLTDNFGKLQLSTAKKHFFVTSYDVALDGPLFFNLKGIQTGSIPDFLFVEAARSTSAAPTFFPAQNLQIDDITHAVIDGGMYANNPSWPALKFLAENLLEKNDLVNLVSIGTGFQSKTRLPNEVAGKGVTWIPDILRMLMKNSMTLSEQAAESFVIANGGFYHRLEVELPHEIVADMDYTSPVNIAELKRITLPTIIQDLPKIIADLSSTAKPEPSGSSN